MTPKFDNLASLLMEMSRGKYISDEKKLKIAEYIEQFPEVAYTEIADVFGVSSHSVLRIAKELNIQRGHQDVWKHREKDAHPNRKLSDEKRLELAQYIEQFPETSYEEIAAAFDVSLDFVVTIAKELGVDRGLSSAGKFHAGKETHPQRKLTDAQEKEILDYWLANHHDMTSVDLAKWINQQFNVVIQPSGLRKALRRIAAKHNKRLPAFPVGRVPMRRTADKHRNEPGSGKLPTQGSQQFSGSDQIVPSNPKHGGPAHPPK